MNDTDYEDEWLGEDKPEVPEDSPETVARKKAVADAAREYAEGYDATPDEKAAA